MFIAGYSSDGVYAGGATLPCGGEDPADISCDASGNVFVCGDFQLNLAFATPFVIANDTLPADSSSWNENLYLAKFAFLKPDTTFKHFDTTFCGRTPLILSAPADYSNYVWSNGVTSPNDTVATAGSYWVTGSGACSAITVIDTFVVSIGNPDTSYSRSDTMICSSKSLLLTAPTGYSGYLWSNGTSGTDFQTAGPGTFWVICSKGCGPLIDTFYVVKSPIDLSFSLGNDTTSCTPLILNVPLTGVTCLWQDGSAGNTYNANNSGLYTVTVNEQGCSFTDSIMLRIFNVNQHFDDTTLCREQTVSYTLQAEVPPGGKVIWSTGSVSPSIVVTDTGRYSVTVSDSVCEAMDTVYVHSEFCECKALLPNAFTPNNDGTNDFFFPIFLSGCVISDYSFSIFNRWGQVVFYSNDPLEKWDGFFKGVHAEFGVYMYELEYTAGLKKNKYFDKGDVTLIR